MATAGGTENGALDLTQSGIDKAHQALSILDQLKLFARPLLTHPATLPISVMVAVAGIVLLVEAHRIKRARLEDHRSGANMGR